MEKIGFGREVTSNSEAALQREWLVTNGIGGYASATVALANTRRYHGLLVAALRPPLGRMLLVSKLEATARLGTDLFPLTTNEYLDGTINPHGYHNLESFELDGMTPVFCWAVAGCLLKQRIWMAYGQNTTYVTYTLVRAAHPIALEIIPLCTAREPWGKTDARGWAPNVRSDQDGLRVDAHSGAVPYWLRANRGTFVPGIVRHWSLRHRVESYRGHEDSEDLFAIGRLDTRLEEGETLTLVLTTEREPEMDWRAAYAADRARQEMLVGQAGLDDEPGWIQQLALAADQFVVDRAIWVDAPPAKETTADAGGKTIIAGYPWFEDLGRNAMIALPGLTLATGRPKTAANILRNFSRLIDQGLLPNHLPARADQAESREYGTADGTLWFCHAVHQYWTRTKDRSLLNKLLPNLVEMLEWHIKGSRFGLGVDNTDGLLRIEEAPVGLTWMNAQDGDRVMTPRTGKPVEVNALWYNAVRSVAQFVAEFDHEEAAARWLDLADRIQDSFEARFWNERDGCLYDIVDGPDGDDATLRPNQILAVSLPYSPLKDLEKARSVVDTVTRHLQTSYGLRTLSTRSPAYAHRYGGNRSTRAAAYHQGTVWAWLIGPFAVAHYKVYGDLAKARSFLRPFADHLVSHGVGTVSEIFDGNPPHTPRGCIASACSVAEILYGWLACSDRDFSHS